MRNGRWDKRRREEPRKLGVYCGYSRRMYTGSRVTKAEDGVCSCRRGRNSITRERCRKSKLFSLTEEGNLPGYKHFPPPTRVQGTGYLRYVTS